MAQNGKILDLGEDFVLGSGTVCIDPDKGLMMLLLRRDKNEMLLPKGRKDRGEDLELTATRETYEESGHPCQLMKHGLSTNAPDTTGNMDFHREPIAVQQRISDGIRKIILWYVSQADSSGIWTADTQEEGEDFETKWLPAQEAVDALTFEDDQRIAARALQAFPNLVAQGKKRPS